MHNRLGVEVDIGEKLSNTKRKIYTTMFVVFGLLAVSVVATAVAVNESTNTSAKVAPDGAEEKPDRPFGFHARGGFDARGPRDIDPARFAERQEALKTRCLEFKTQEECDVLVERFANGQHAPPRHDHRARLAECQEKYSPEECEERAAAHAARHEARREHRACHESLHDDAPETAEPTSGDEEATEDAASTTDGSA